MLLFRGVGGFVRMMFDPVLHGKISIRSSFVMAIYGDPPKATWDPQEIAGPNKAVLRETHG